MIGGLAAACALVLPACAFADGPRAYQIDPGHTGEATGTKFAPPLGKRWVRRDLAGQDYNRSVSYPVMAEGKVYVATSSGVYALGRNGRTVWSRAVSTTGVAYDDGRVFAIDQSGTLQALSAASGKVLWTRSLSDFGGVPPTAFGDFVYLASSSGGATGVRQDNGLPVWDSGAPSNGDPPAVDNGKVYTTGGCAETSAMQRTIGVEVWRYVGNCTGGGGAPTVVHGGRVYARDSSHGVVLDTLTGGLKDSFVATDTPAFGGGTGYFVNGNELYARDEGSGIVRWRYRAPGYYGLRVPPVVAGKYVYTVDGRGYAIALSRATGRRVWQNNLHTGAYDTYGRAGIAAAGDTLALSYGGRVVAFRHGHDTPGVNDPDKPRPTSALNLRTSRRYTWYRHPVTLTASFDGYSNEGTPIEIQADRWPWGRFRRIARRRIRSYEANLRVRPTRNTRYRAVYRGTYPVTRSRRITVFSDVDLRFRVYARGRRHVLVRVGIRGPRPAHLRGSRWFVYFFRRHARAGRRLGHLKMRGTRTHVRAQRVLRTPSARRSDLFIVCRRERRDDGYGRWYPWMKRCGDRRLR